MLSETYCVRADPHVMAAGMGNLPPLEGATIGERVRFAYKANGWKRKQFERKLRENLPNVSYSQIDKWEKGTIPSERSLVAIAKTTGYAVNDFLTGLGKPHPALLNRSDERAGKLVERFLQRSGLTPLTDAELTQIKLCAADDDATEEQLRAVLQARRIADSDSPAAKAALEDAYKAITSQSKPSPTTRRSQRH